MSGQQPNTPRQDEQAEYPFIGPFGGINSEVALSQIGRSGFAEVQNIIFRLSQALTVPGFTPVVSPSNEVIVGIADFFNVNGTRIPVVWTPTGMFRWNAGTWVQVTGALTGAVSQFMSASVVGYKIYFSQQKDVVQVWDGITAGFAAAAAQAVPAKYLTELGFHLLAANTIEGGLPAPNRIHWTGIGDGTDWTSFSSGQTDLFNNLGPITGLTRLFQSGFAFQQWGITQIIPTGIGLNPFQFIPMGAYAKGNILPYSLAAFGELIAAYVGKDDIYLFDGTTSQGIGSRPIDGNRRLGARQRIFTDLFSAIETNIFGFIMTTANGFEYESYWLFMPSLNKAWVYHFDEGNWTQVFFNTGQLVGPVGSFPLQQVPRIEDLVGRIIDQSWTPATLGNANQLDTMAISDSVAQSISYFNIGASTNQPTSGSINANDGWYIKSGQLTFDDTRHMHSVKKVRLLINDIASGMTFNMRLTNEFGVQTPVRTVTVGTGSGGTLTQVLSFTISGKFITWELSGPKGTNVSLVEITPVYDVGGEVQPGR